MACKNNCQSPFFSPPQLLVSQPEGQRSIRSVRIQKKLFKSTYRAGGIIITVGSAAINLNFPPTLVIHEYLCGTMKPYYVGWWLQSAPDDTTQGYSTSSLHVSVCVPDDFRSGYYKGIFRCINWGYSESLTGIFNRRSTHQQHEDVPVSLSSAQLRPGTRTSLHPAPGRIWSAASTDRHVPCRATGISHRQWKCIYGGVQGKIHIVQVQGYHSETHLSTVRIWSSRTRTQDTDLLPNCLTLQGKYACVPVCVVIFVSPIPIRYGPV